MTDIDYKRPGIAFWRKLPDGSAQLTCYQYLNGEFTDSPLDFKITGGETLETNFNEIYLMAVESVSGHSGTVYRFHKLVGVEISNPAYRTFICSSKEARSTLLKELLVQFKQYLNFEVPGLFSFEERLQRRMGLTFPPT